MPNVSEHMRIAADREKPMERIRLAHRHEAGGRTDDCRRKSDAAGFAPMTVYQPRHKATLLRARVASPIL